MNIMNRQWRAGRRGTVVADEGPCVSGGDVAEYYGGILIAESVHADHVPMIAAAPDMYRALEMISGANMDEPHIPPMALALIVRAMAKARGEAA